MLQEDNDGGADRRSVSTSMDWNWEENVFTICKPLGDLEVIPAMRTFTLEFMNISSVSPEVTADGRPVDIRWEYDQDTSALKVQLPAFPADTEIVVTFREPLCLAENLWQKEFFRRLYQAEMLYEDKEKNIWVSGRRCEPRGDDRYSWYHESSGRNLQLSGRDAAGEKVMNCGGKRICS